MKQLSEYSARYNASPSRRAMTNALAKTELSDVTFDNRRLREDRFHFSVEIPTLPVTNQERSGRCWIFAGANLLREEVAKKCNLDRFELSQNYIAFWDKFEKANYFLESVIDRIDCPIDDRTLCWILSTGVQDGGQWDMFVSLIEKYGVVPKEAMDETYQSSHTAAMNGLLNTKLRQFAARLQNRRSACGKRCDAARNLFPAVHLPGRAPGQLRLLLDGQGQAISYGPQPNAEGLL